MSARHLAGGQFAIPVAFGFDNVASVARDTLVQKCLVHQQLC